MSHYAVAVFSNYQDDAEFDRLLDPYDENSHLVKHIYEKDANEEYKKFKERNPNSSFENFLECFCLKTDEETGKFVYYCNDNGKWDYYTLDGKDYLFDPKKGEELDEDSWYYKKSQLDFFKKNKLTKKSIKEIKQFFEDGTGDFFTLYNRDYILDRYKTAERYIKECEDTIPYAFITPDGIWHSMGEMGWFACSDDTMESYDKYYEEWVNFINDKSNDPYVSIVDCHI